MPVYEYECISCGSRFDKKQGFDEKPGALCPKCLCPAKRVICPAPIIFKGSGFYITDNGKPETKTEASGNSKDKAIAPTPAKSETTEKSSEAMGKK
jgi:putative FmdB family regulatory protein